MTKRFLCLLFLAICILWLNISNEFISSPDAPLHAYLGKQLSTKPLSEWIVMTWDGQREFFDHPHLMPWLIALSVKLFGVSTLAAILPALLLATMTVPVVYLIGRLLLNEYFGLLAATFLVCTPRFVRSGRHPMLEPALEFFVFLSIYFGLRGFRDKTYRPFVYCGLALAFAFLTKGPPALLAPAVLGGFYILEARSEQSERLFLLPKKKLIIATGTVTLVPIAIILGLDLWHQRMTGETFFGRFLSFLLKNGTGGGPNENREPFFFVKVVYQHFWPWWPFAVAAPLVTLFRVLRHSDRRLVRATQVGALGFFGAIVGFSIVLWRNDWYLNLALPAFALLVAVPFWLWIRPESMDRYYSRVTLSFAVVLTTLCAFFPPLFAMPRPDYTFISGARSAVHEQLAGERISDCLEFNHWAGAFLVRYYLSAERVACGEKARYGMIRAESAVLTPEHKILYASHPFLLVRYPN